MKKTLLQLQDERALLTQKADAMVQLTKTEVRKMTNEEKELFATLTTEIAQLNNEIQLAEVRRENAPLIEVGETRSLILPQFSLLKAIENRANGMPLTDEYAKVVAKGRDEFRKSGLSCSGDIVLPMEYRADVLAGTSTQGSEAVQINKLTILEPLRAALVTVQAGADIMTNLIGNVSIPTYAATTAYWAAETGNPTDGAGAFGSVELAPKRLVAQIAISKQFLIQDSVQAEATLMRDIVRAISAKLESTIFGKANISSTQPLGLFYTAPSIKGTATFLNMVALETAVDSSNALQGNLKYITNAGARGILKTTPKVTAQANYLMDENGNINGYPTLVTNHVASALQTGGDEYGIIFGNWQDFIIGQWGGFDLTIDPYSLAGNGKVLLTVNAYFDAKVKRSESFKTGSLK